MLQKRRDPASTLISFHKLSSYPNIGDANSKCALWAFKRQLALQTRVYCRISIVSPVGVFALCLSGYRPNFPLSITSTCIYSSSFKAGCIWFLQIHVKVVDDLLVFPVEVYDYPCDQNRNSKHQCWYQNPTNIIGCPAWFVSSTLSVAAAFTLTLTFTHCVDKASVKTMGTIQLWKN